MWGWQYEDGNTGWQVEDSRIRMAVSGWQSQDGSIITVVSWRWCSIFIESFFQFGTHVIFELSSFRVQYSVTDCYPGMHLYHASEMAKLGVSFCVASWLTFDCCNQQYTYWTTLMMTVEVIFFVIMLVLGMPWVHYTPIYTNEQYGLLVCCLWFLWLFCHHLGFVNVLAL